ncbi:MAG: hypothetical protein JJT78_06700 [Leptospira sp.]|nr:hypothetical protein [Leptospira sp.]
MKQFQCFNYTVILLSLFSLFGLSGFLFAERPTVLTFKERETAKQIEAQRKAGFGDIEIDTLHESIAKNIQGIRKMVELGVDKQAALYLPDLPATEANIFKEDKDGKVYVQFVLPQGQSYVDWPKIYLYDGVGFIYPSEDFSKIDKIVLMFRRVNAEGFVYIKEMRRLINPSPNFSASNEDGTSQIDSNSDIKLEYYQSFTSNTIWPDKPNQPFEPDVVMELNTENDPLPYEKQKLIMRQYKKILRKVDKEMAIKYRGLELDQKRMVSKMLDFK